MPPDYYLSGALEDHQRVRQGPRRKIRSLGRTLEKWRTEILAHVDIGVSNGPAECLNLMVNTK